MSAEITNKRTGAVIATCPDLPWAMGYMAMWGITLHEVTVRIVK